MSKHQLMQHGDNEPILVHPSRIEHMTNLGYKPVTDKKRTKKKPTPEKSEVVENG